MSQSLVLLDWLEDQQIAWIRLNDPTRLNAMSEAMAQQFRQVYGQLQQHAKLRAVILSGQGTSFSAGGDLAMLEAKRERSPEINERDMTDFYYSFLDLLNLEVPLIAAAHGWSVGAGCCLVAACDLRLADPGARFKVPFLQMGLFPGMGSSHWFSQRMGPWASEFLLTGATMDAQQAAHRGLVTSLSAEGEVLELAQQQARRLLANGPECSRDLLRVLRGPKVDLQRALDREAHLQALSYGREEFAQGLKRAGSAK